VYRQLYIVLVPSIHNIRTQRPDVLEQLGYIWRHVSAISRPSSGKQGIVLLRYSQFDCTLTILFLVGLRMAG